MSGLILLLKTFIVQDLLKNKLRTGLTIMGIALGVAIFLAMSLANKTVLSQFQESVDQVSGQTNLEIVSKAGMPFDEGVLTQLTWLWDVKGEFSPFIEETAAWSDLHHPETVELIGVDLISQALSSLHPETNTPNTSKTLSSDPMAAFNIGAVLVGNSFAQAHHLKTGSVFSLLINESPQQFTVVSILPSQGLGKAYGGNVVLMDVSTAQTALHLTGQLMRIDIKVPEGLVSSVQQRLQKSLPAYLSIQRPARRGEQVQKMLQAFQYNLTALSFVALLVGLFLIYNTMSIALLRRRADIGTLRALGTSKQQIFCLFMGEALWLGLSGSLIGVVLGVFLAQGALQAVSQTVQTLYVAQPVQQLEIHGQNIVIALLLGVGLTLFAALFPILEAMAVAPAEAARKTSFERRVPRYLGRLFLLGILLALFALVSSFQEAWAGLPVWGYLAALLAVLAAAFWLPALLYGVLGRSRSILQRCFGVTGNLACLSLQGALGRTSVAVASLMVGIAMMVSLSIMIGSFRHTVIHWVNDTIKADLWIQPASRFVSKRSGVLTSAVISQIKSIPGVEAVDEFTEVPIEYQGKPTHLGAGNFKTLAHYGNLQFLSGESPQQVFRRVLNQPAAVVTENFATRYHKKVGDWVSLPTPRGWMKVKIEGVYYDYTSEQGYIVIEHSRFEHYYRSNQLTNVAVYLKPTVQPEEVRQLIFNHLGTKAKLQIQTNRELRGEVIRIFDQTFAITYAFHIISITVAVMGILNMLLALILESRREFGILRYIGATQQQIKKVVLLEAGLLGFLGNLAGTGVGGVLALLLINVINKQSFGWTIHFALPWDFLLQSFCLVMLASIGSGWLPAKMASEIPTPEVLRNE